MFEKYGNTIVDSNFRTLGVGTMHIKVQCLSFNYFNFYDRVFHT